MSDATHVTQTFIHQRSMTLTLRSTGATSLPVDGLHAQQKDKVALILCDYLVQLNVGYYKRNLYNGKTHGPYPSQRRRMSSLGHLNTFI